MKTALLAAALLLPLAACESKVETLSTTAEDPQAAALAKRKPVELPPSMRASVTFRCKDNSLVYVDFFSGDKLAHLRTDKTGKPIMLTAEKAGDPLKADGYEMTGDPKSITLTRPGKGTLTCRT